jgi:3-methyladenine DNA glycosylase AlkD
MEIIKKIQSNINRIDGRKTNEYRNIAKKFKKELDLKTLSEIYEISEALLESRKWAETIIAYQIIFDQRKRYDEGTFQVFEQWLFQYIEDWWDCDDFMTHAFQVALMKYPNNIAKIKGWVNHQKFAVRRSAAVILIRPVQKGLIEKKLIFEIADLLMNDPHYLVQKGYGWLLKESSAHYHDHLIAYLQKNIFGMSRTAFRYALEKLPSDEKTKLMNMKKEH